MSKKLENMTIKLLTGRLDELDSIEAINYAGIQGITGKFEVAGTRYRIDVEKKVVGLIPYFKITMTSSNGAKLNDTITGWKLWRSFNRCFGKTMSMSKALSVSLNPSQLQKLKNLLSV